VAMQTVVIAGTGLIGASFGLALKAAGFGGTIVGVSSQRSLEEAARVGAIDEGAPVEEAVPRADLVLLSQTISGILAALPSVAALARPEALITDAGSTKARIVQRARESKPQALFLGGHPMAGKASRGASGAEADLFRGRVWVLTPDPAGSLERPAAREFRAWLEKIGARMVLAAPEEHDRLVAAASHVPQMLSTALSAVMARRADSSSIAAVAGPGLADMTRLALSSYEIWRDILATNPEEIEAALAVVEQELRAMREALTDPGMETRFAEAMRFAAQVRREER
jgi:prephenate dehydrogenase